MFLTLRGSSIAVWLTAVDNFSTPCPFPLAEELDSCFLFVNCSVSLRDEAIVPSSFASDTFFEVSTGGLNELAVRPAATQRRSGRAESGSLTVLTWWLGVSFISLKMTKCSLPCRTMMPILSLGGVGEFPAGNAGSPRRTNCDASARMTRKSKAIPDGMLW